MSTLPTDINPQKSITQLRPNVPKGTHPIETGKYLVATKQINEFLSKLDDWIEFRTLGAIIYGNPRIGKTQAIRYATHYLTEQYPSILVFSHLCKTHRTPSGDAFYMELLQSLKHKYVKQGRLTDKRDRIIKFLIAEAYERDLNRLLFFMDDAQLLHEMHYKWWMDIQNALSHEGITVTTLLIGQEELLHYKTTLLDAKQNQIVGRFMTNQYHFRGLETAADISECLKGYDDDSVYPEGSGYSFTQYFFPEAYASQSFRLHKSAKAVANSIQQLRAYKGLPKKFELPMQFMTLATEYCLKRFGVDGKNLDKLAVEHWAEAFVNVGYSDFVGNQLTAKLTE